MDEKIQILLIAFSYDENDPCDEFLKLVMDTYSKLSDKPKSLEFIIGINCESFKPEIINGYGDYEINIVDIRFENPEENKFKHHMDIKKNTVRSRCHGDALNELFKYTNQKYFMTVDSDCFCVKKGWDTIIKSLLKDNVICAGSEHHYTSDKYKGFPNVISCIFLTSEWKKLGIDFVFDDDPKFMRHVDKDQSLMYEITKASHHRALGSDVGSKLTYLAHINGYKGIPFRSLRIKHKDKGRIFLTDLSVKKDDSVKKTEEFIYKGEPFFVHLGDGRNRLIDKDSFYERFLKRLKTFIKDKYDITI
jgi:hypothetical protein